MQLTDFTEQAQAVLAGGCDSPVRSGWAVGGAPFVQTRGDGAYAFDERGRRYVDYIMAYGPLLLGYNHPAVARNLDELAANGVLFGSTHAEEMRLAARIRSHLPVMERVRFTTTGTEAVMSAVRVARAFTRRDLVLRFAGNYHGHFDLALFGAGASAHIADPRAGGVPPDALAHVAVARYNDLDDVDRLLHGREGDLAAILVEPICANMGLVLPVPGFLEGLRERAARYGAVLIFDEIITWLRLGLGGAQTLNAVAPDLMTIGKILGGGFPIAGFGGRESIMAVLAPDGDVFTGGTHAGNPFAVGMAHRMLDALEAHPEWYDRMRTVAAELARGLRGALSEAGMPFAVLQCESIVDFAFREGPPVRNFDEARSASKARYASYYHAMRERGILLPPSQNEVMFVSAAHSADDVDRTVRAAESALSDVA